ncbi:MULTISPECIES: cobalamin biosynthesis protein [unclassified Pseudomonas]|uniref:cobalamin biosynthesis protein n=1 Tax=unclassified Pseudomonas TaxID=196821 RepID=UPI0021C79725|nr:MULTISPECIES: cobalamin biosynthesis protein [unclassified Pseudomonas]MCU1733566.1 cobalamin biosynthesis protein [Pseudomonas sp. 20P_3.2_Bac4]MCU1742478.1 cobalamin biosynthesis protein [Pseudomonas sp. 20P_3.2_Bac5]
MPFPPGATPLFAGLGCRRSSPADNLAGLLRRTLKAHDLPLEALAGLASIDLKHDEPGLLQLAAQLALPLSFFSAAQLAPFAARLSHRSPVAFRHSGCHGVAESCALALAEQVSGLPAQLRVTRIVQDDMTLALAWAPSFGG